MTFNLSSVKHRGPILRTKSISSYRFYQTDSIPFAWDIINSVVNSSVSSQTKMAWRQNSVGSFQTICWHSSLPAILTSLVDVYAKGNVVKCGWRYSVEMPLSASLTSSADVYGDLWTYFYLLRTLRVWSICTVDNLTWILKALQGWVWLAASSNVITNVCQRNFVVLDIQCSSTSSQTLWWLLIYILT